MSGEIAETTAGKVRGAEIDDGILAWRGIPYAAAPVGDLRLRPPRPVEPWSGVRDATSYGAPSLQPSPEIQNRFGLAKQLHDAWGTFITTGAPTAATGGGLPAWPRYDTATRQTMIFHAEGPYVAADPNGTQHAAWDGRDWQPGTWWPVPGMD